MNERTPQLTYRLKGEDEINNFYDALEALGIQKPGELMSAIYHEGFKVAVEKLRAKKMEQLKKLEHFRVKEMLYQAELTAHGIFIAKNNQPVKHGRNDALHSATANEVQRDLHFGVGSTNKPSHNNHVGNSGIHHGKGTRKPIPSLHAVG